MKINIRFTMKTHMKWWQMQQTPCFYHAQNRKHAYKCSQKKGIHITMQINIRFTMKTHMK